MKRFITLALTVALAAASLTACINAGDLFESFYDDVYLDFVSLIGMPEPKLDDSMLRSDSLYLNLTDYEYHTYVGSLISYLRSRDDVYFLSYVISTNLVGEILPQDVCAPIGTGFSVKNTGTLTIVFSTSPTLGEHGELRSPVRISFRRGEDKLLLTN